MEFSEGNARWHDVPTWANFLIKLGYAWVDHTHASRAIAIVSMPSDSAGAGLIALGAMRKRMELDDANDLGTHFQRILDQARRGGTVLVHYASERGRFMLDIDPNGDVWAKKVDTTEKIKINRITALKWRFDGEAPVAILHGKQLPNIQVYSNLLSDGNLIKPTNFSESDSGICLAGRIVGEYSTKACMSDIHFRTDGLETDLSKLMTIQNWIPSTVSRIIFYNTRTNSFDRKSGSPMLVVADGDASFLNILSKPEFDKSDVIGVIHRTIERDRLEEVGGKLEGLRQWYDLFPPQPDQISECPRGITVMTLVKKMVA
jgi:hypothetical protein